MCDSHEHSDSNSPPRIPPDNPEFTEEYVIRDPNFSGPAQKYLPEVYTNEPPADGYGHLVNEIPRACLECARHGLTCDIMSLPCKRCVDSKMPCVGPVWSFKELHGIGTRRQIRQLRELTSTQPTKAYGAMWYLASCFEEGKQGWEELRDSVDPEEEEDAETRADNKVLREYITEVEGMAEPLLQEWRDAGEPEEVDPALHEAVRRVREDARKDADKAWAEGSDISKFLQATADDQDKDGAGWPASGGFTEVTEKDEF